MTRRVSLSLITLALFAVPATAQLMLLAPALPSPNDVVKVIDMLTRKDSDTSMDVKFGKTTGQGKLLVARTRVDVNLERSSRNWRGRVITGMTVPSDVSFSVDLSALKAEQIRTDEKVRRLIITMPTPQVEDVTPILTEVKIKNDYNRARFKFLDTDTSRELQNVMLREDYQAKARKEAQKHITRVRAESKGTLESFLRRLLAGAFPGLTIVVE